MRLPHNPSQWFLVGSIALILALIIGYFSVDSFSSWLNHAYEVLTSDDKSRIREWVSQYGLWGPVLIIVAMVAQMFLIVMPTVLLMIIAVMAYGPVWGTIINVTAIVAASSIGYALGRALSEASLERMIGEHTVHKVSKEADRYGVWAVILARLSPFLSNDAISFIAGVIQMGFWRYLASTLAGILPLALMIAYFGKSNDSMKTGLLVVSIVGLLVLGGKIWLDRRTDRQEKRGSEAISSGA
ncbi:MAG: hypothetical protein E1N59_142 [Puniceicoccaceae bacterium 5H]|nr:MAG: hypothetical protein E1N59_142 [Puniceicoccaceae bacterium 5H]